MQLQLSSIQFLAVVITSAVVLYFIARGTSRNQSARDTFLFVFIGAGSIAALLTPTVRQPDAPPSPSPTAHSEGPTRPPASEPPATLPPATRPPATRPTEPPAPPPSFPLSCVPPTLTPHGPVQDESLAAAKTCQAWCEIAQGDYPGYAERSTQDNRSAKRELERLSEEIHCPLSFR